MRLFASFAAKSRQQEINLAPVAASGAAAAAAPLKEQAALAQMRPYCTRAQIRPYRSCIGHVQELCRNPGSTLLAFSSVETLSTHVDETG